jgi:hypothetical protein
MSPSVGERTTRKEEKDCKFSDDEGQLLRDAGQLSRRTCIARIEVTGSTGFPTKGAFPVASESKGSMPATNHQPTDSTKSPQLLCEQRVFITSADKLRGYLGRYFGFLIQKASQHLPPSPPPPLVPGGQCYQQTNRKLGRQQACENVPQAWRSHAVLSNNATCIPGLGIFS